MSLRNLLGSPAASALLGNPVVGGVVVGAGAVMVVAGGAAWGGDKLYQHFRKKNFEKYIAEMKRVNEIHFSTLGKISSRGIENKAFPLLFVLEASADNKDEIIPKFILLTKEQFDSAGNFTSARRLNRSEIEVDPMLLIYLEELKMAIRKLKLYCKDLNINISKENDKSSRAKQKVTLYVLHYCISIIDSFMSFKGFYWDIDCVHQFSKFIYKYYMSFQNNNSQHQTHLKEVFESLEKAEMALRAHQDELTIEDMLEQLLKNSLDAEQYLLTTFTKFAVENKNEELVDYADADDLMQGILRKQATMARVGNFVYSEKSEVRLQDSLLTDWVKKIHELHLKIIDPSYYIKKEEMLPAEELFSVARVKDKPEVLKKLKNHFNDCGNFMTRMSANGSETKLITISDPNKIWDRTEKLGLIAAVTYKVQHLIKLLTVLINSEKLLGEIRFAKPDLFNKVRHILRGVIENVQQSIEDIALKIKKIDIENKHNIPHPGKSVLTPVTLFDELEKICISWSEMLSDMDKREKNLVDKMKLLSKHPAREVKHDLFKFLNLYKDSFKLPPEPEEEKAIKKDVEATKLYNIETDLKYLENRVESILLGVKNIKTSNAVDANECNELGEELFALGELVKGLLGGKDKPSEKEFSDTLSFVLSVCRESWDFLKGNKEQRQNSATSFFEIIQQILPDQRHGLNSSSILKQIGLFNINQQVLEIYKKVVDTSQKFTTLKY